MPKKENPFRLQPVEGQPGQFHVLYDQPDPVTTTPRPVTFVQNGTRSEMQRIIYETEVEIEGWMHQIRQAKAKLADLKQALELFPEAGAGV